MTEITHDKALALAHRIVESARALVADPNNLDVRRAYMSRTFNLDRAAAAWIALEDRATPHGHLAVDTRIKALEAAVNKAIRILSDHKLGEPRRVLDARDALIQAKDAADSPPPLDPRVKALEAWEWLFDHKDLSLERRGAGCGGGDPLAWMVFRVSGDVNDRERRPIAHSIESPLAAVLAAKAAITGGRPS